MAEKKTTTAEERARHRAQYLSGLVWHAGAFVIINAFFWILDLAGAGGVNWAFWITIFWGFALAFHALAYYVDGRNLEETKAEQYLQDERQHTSGV